MGNFIRCWWREKSTKNTEKHWVDAFEQESNLFFPEEETFSKTLYKFVGLHKLKSKTNLCFLKNFVQNKIYCHEEYKSGMAKNTIWKLILFCQVPTKKKKQDSQ